MIQRNFRRHKGYEYYVKMKREKAEADKRISTVIVSCLLGAANMKSFIHPWFRHLPPEIQEVLEQIKASLQRTIGLTRVSVYAGALEESAGLEETTLFFQPYSALFFDGPVEPVPSS